MAQSSSRLTLSTMLLYRARLVSMGQLWMQRSTSCGANQALYSHCHPWKGWSTSTALHRRMHTALPVAGGCCTPQTQNPAGKRPRAPGTSHGGRRTQKAPLCVSLCLYRRGCASLAPRRAWPTPACHMRNFLNYSGLSFEARVAHLKLWQTVNTFTTSAAV